jgi:uncharacterized protein (TIGR02118 family)
VVKIFAVDPKRPDITTEQFHAHWRGPHAELALRIKTQRRYVQNHRLPVEVPGLAPCPYEGIAEVWFDDLAAATSLLTDPDYTEYALLDEPNFVDMSGIAFFPTSEHVVVEGPPIEKDTELVKLLLLVRRKDGLTPGEFAERWREYGSVVTDSLPGLRRYVQCPAAAEAYADGQPVFDGVGEFWWDDVEAFRRAWQANAEDGRTREGAAAFIDFSVLTGMLAEEYRVLWPGPLR